MKKALTILIPALLAGCASTDYKQYIAAQEKANEMAIKEQKPLVEITAQPGQSITGLAGPNEWVGVFSQGLGVLGTLGGIHYGGKAAVGLASEVRQAGTAGYPFVQAPTTLSGTGTIGGGAYSDSTHAPTVATAPDPLVVNQPAPVIVNQPAPTVVTQPAPVIVPATPPTVVNPVVITPDPGFTAQ